MTSVAVVDIGSNSIKLLVAAPGPAGTLTELATQAIDARISEGISRDQPTLSASSMTRGINAIEELLAAAAPFQPQATVLVATSAVRDASNGEEFRTQVQAATGHAVRILSGDEEANLIGRGLTCDPELAGLRDFYVLDLGGGSLECLAFRDREVEQATSLKLGCVRLAEKFVDDVTGPFPAWARVSIFRHVREVLVDSGFSFSLPAPATAVGTGGTMACVHAILAARAKQTSAQENSPVSVHQLVELLDLLGPMTLTARSAIPGLPAARADVFPAALATLIAVARFGGLSVLQGSAYNLRWGLAAEALGR